MINVFVITAKKDITLSVFILIPIINFVGTYFSSSNQGLESHWPVDSSQFTQLYWTVSVQKLWN